MNDYNFLYSGLKNSGLLQQKTEQKNRAKVKKALSELVKEGVVRTFNVKSNKYGGRKIIDVKYTINATQEFISEQNESYHLQYELFRQSVIADNPNVDPNNIVMEGYEPNRILGLDPLLGDIIYQKNELPIIRGGFQGRNEEFYAETPQERGLSSVNISINSQRSSRRLF